METNSLVECFRVLTIEDIKVADWSNFLELKLDEVYDKLQINYQHTTNSLSNITSLNFSQVITVEWKYICLGLYIINELFKAAKHSDIVFLSVQETKDFKKFLGTLTNIGICTKLQPNLPFHSKPKVIQTEDIFCNYNILKCTTFGLTEFLKQPILRFTIIPECLKEMLVSLYQISYCPLKKPSKVNDTIPNKIYEKLLQEQHFFIQILKHLEQTIHPNIYVKDTMAILHKNAPSWFKKQVSQALTNILRSKHGVELVASALFGDHLNDKTHNWKILDVFSKLILSCKKFPDFKENICKQLIMLLNKQNEKSIAETIFIHFTKTFYKEDPEICKSIFIREIITPFLHFTYKTHKFDVKYITTRITFTSRMLHGIFVQNSTTEEIVVPVDILQPIISIVYKFYTITSDYRFEAQNNDLKDILILYLENQDNNYIRVFDRLLFDIDYKEILSFRNDILIEIDANSIKLKSVEFSVRHSTLEHFDCMFKLIKSNQKLLLKFYTYLLNCITNESKYFQKASEDLLQMENELNTEYFERKITVYKFLSDIAENKCVQKELNEHPTEIIAYINKVLNKTLELRIHLNNEIDNEEFQSFFSIVVILENLMQSSKNIEEFKILLEPLKLIQAETKNKETKDSTKRILGFYKEGSLNNSKPVIEESKTELDKAIDDICNELLPIRGHGLLTLTKLIEKKDNETMKRKQFVLNVLQQNLTNADSFIYLSAINGLAAMADIFTDTVLNVLCQEYSESHRKDAEDSSEIRIKLGEVLVKVTKVLSDMAPKHKPLLLNTFLIGTKDDDDLIRASSLSNLGEICRVLGYKLGTMFTEVLVCVHSIIATDKSPQARRAAVSVIRQLFIGLDQEIIAFFKDDILPIYRTLKHVYNNDTDDVMKLQAQLALEELNECMKNFVFPKPELNFDKKIVMLD